MAAVGRTASARSGERSFADPADARLCARTLSARRTGPVDDRRLAAGRRQISLVARQRRIRQVSDAGRAPRVPEPDRQIGVGPAEQRELLAGHGASPRARASAAMPSENGRGA